MSSEPDEIPTPETPTETPENSGPSLFLTAMAVVNTVMLPRIQARNPSEDAEAVEANRKAVQDFLTGPLLDAMRTQEYVISILKKIEKWCSHHFIAMNDFSQAVLGRSWTATMKNNIVEMTPNGSFLFCILHNFHQIESNDVKIAFFLVKMKKEDEFQLYKEAYSTIDSTEVLNSGATGSELLQKLLSLLNKEKFPAKR